MPNKIEKIENEEVVVLSNQEISQILFKEKNIDVEIGYSVISTERPHYGYAGYLGTVTGFKTNDKGEVVYIKYEGIECYGIGGERNVRERTINFEYINQYIYSHLSEQELKERALSDIMNPEKIVDEDAETESKSTEITILDKETFVALKRKAIRKAAEVQARSQILAQVMKDKMEQLNKIVAPLLAQVSRINKVIWTIELYLGLKEDIYHIQAGAPAGEDEPIRFLQAREYMDEQVGDPSDGGICINSVDKFFDWLCIYNDYFGYPNYNLLLPYEKCVRIMRVRRKLKEYPHQDPWISDDLNRHNMRTVLLIRNGENIYSIETDMDMGERLFPNPDEIIKIQQNMAKDYENTTRVNGEEVNDEWINKKIQEDTQETTDFYKRNFIILQGLIDRTEVFGNLAGHVNLMTAGATKKGQVEFIYDSSDDKILGEDPFYILSKFKEATKNIQVGDRVLLVEGKPWQCSNGSYFPLIYSRSDDWGYPKHPEVGKEYDIIKHKDVNRPVFMYIPNEDIWDENLGRHRPRKKRVTYSYDSGAVVNLNAFTWRDMEWLWDMFHNRRLRIHYSNYMSKLKMIYIFMNQRFEQEKPFVQMIMGQTGVSEEVVKDALHHWRTKNKYKRELSSNDVKATRMIIKYINNLPKE